MLLVGLGGSLRVNSRSLAALKFGLDYAVMQGHSVELLDLLALALPMYHPSYELEEYPEKDHPNIEKLLDACRRADGFLWSSPTYHGTVSGLFKNAVDYIEFLSDDARPYLHGCPVGLISANDQTTFAAMADIVHELRGWLAPTRVVVNRTHFTDDLVIHDERVGGRIRRVVDEVMGFAATRRQH